VGKAAILENMWEFDYELARSLPPSIRFGSSTWTYEDWKGLIYHKKYKSEKEFKQTCLAEYADFPYFRTVGVDRFFYSPPKLPLLQRYASLVPDGFLWVTKVWERLTIPRYPTLRRYGVHAGQDNPDFMNPALFLDYVLPPFEAPEVKVKTGPFVFQFPHIPIDVMGRGEFLDRLRIFLSALDSRFQYAVEIRNPEFMIPDYFHILNEVEVTHCFNHWAHMPPLREQMKAAAAGGGIKAPFYVSRMLTPLGLDYEKAVELMSPYNSIKKENDRMRQDGVQLVKRALERKKDAFILVNNRSEGCSPMTIDAIAKMIRSEGLV
jgi:uncharacterized protein YecE (DUF72 family)